jgi:hypothetical protein
MSPSQASETCASASSATSAVELHYANALRRCQECSQKLLPVLVIRWFCHSASRIVGATHLAPLCGFHLRMRCALCGRMGARGGTPLQVNPNISLEFGGSWPCLSGSFHGHQRLCSCGFAIARHAFDCGRVAGALKRYSRVPCHPDDRHWRHGN